jgi:hypothetical protein
MYIYNDIEDIDSKNTFFYKPTINKLSGFKLFYKIAYNIDLFVLNTLLINVPISTTQIIKENNNYKCVISLDNNFLLRLKEYETQILTNMNHIIKKQYVIFSQKFINNNSIIFNYNTIPENIKLYIKISGMWESDTQYGLITKIHNSYVSTVKF